MSQLSLFLPSFGLHSHELGPPCCASGIAGIRPEVILSKLRFSSGSACRGRRRRTNAEERRRISGRSDDSCRRCVLRTDPPRQSESADRSATAKGLWGYAPLGLRPREESTSEAPATLPSRQAPRSAPLRRPQKKPSATVRRRSPGGKAGAVKRAGGVAPPEATWAVTSQETQSQKQSDVPQISSDAGEEVRRTPDALARLENPKRCHRRHRGLVDEAGDAAQRSRDAATGSD